MARLIVPTDFSPTAEKALDQAFLLAQNGNDEVELLHIITMPPSTESPRIYDYVLGGKDEEEERLKALATARIEALGLPEMTRWRVKVVYAEYFFGAITRRFKQCRAKLVVMGTTGATGLANKIFGSNTAILIGRAALPVLAVPPNWQPSRFEKLEFCLEPEDVRKHKRDINKWAKWMGATASIVYFAQTDDSGLETRNDALPFKTVITVQEDTEYEDLVEYSNGLKGTALCMFVRERPTFFRRLFDRSLTKQVADRIKIPMLALPTEAEA